MFLAKRNAVFFVVICAIQLAGCSVRPLPEDVTREKTYEIVQKIRCEVRDALRAYLKGALRKFNHNEIADALERDPSLYREFDQKARSKLDPRLQRILNRHDHGAIGYEFTFDISETNVLNADLSLGKQLMRGPLSFSAGGKLDKKRGNKRNFIIIDNFEALIRYLDVDNAGREICNPDPASPNLSYPIAGSLGLDEFVGTFFNLYEFGSLANKKDAPSIFADTMEFTTTISSDLGGKVTLNPIAGRGAQLTGLDAGYDTSRTDKHTLVMSIVLAAEETRKGGPITASEQNAEARELARLELDRQRLNNLEDENAIIRRSILNIVSEE